MDVRPGGGVGEAQPPQRPEQTRGGVLRPPQEPQVPELLPFPYFSRRPTRVRPKYRNRSVSKYREEELTGPRFGCGRRAVRPRRVSLSIARNPSDVARDCALRPATAGGGELTARSPYRGRGRSSSRAGSSAAPGPDCAGRILVGLPVVDVRMHRPALTGGVPGRAPFPVIKVRCAT